MKNYSGVFTLVGAMVAGLYALAMFYVAFINPSRSETAFVYGIVAGIIFLILVAILLNQYINSKLEWLVQEQERLLQRHLSILGSMTEPTED